VSNYFKVFAQMAKNKNQNIYVLIVKFWDLSTFQFDSIDLSLISSDSEEVNYNIMPQYHMHKCTKHAETLAGVSMLVSSPFNIMGDLSPSIPRIDFQANAT